MKTPLQKPSLSPRDRQTLAFVFAADSPQRLAELPVTAQALIALELAETQTEPQCWVTEGPEALARLEATVGALSGGSPENVRVFPSRESAEAGDDETEAGRAAARLRTLQACRGDEPPRIILTCVQALLQPVPPPGRLTARRFPVRRGDTLPPEELLGRLGEGGYRFEGEIFRRGEAARRGGIVDVWPPGEDRPVRIEWFGDEVESIRRFDPDSQRSFDRLESVAVTPADLSIDLETEDLVSPLEHLEAGMRWFMVRPESIREHLELYERIPEALPRLASRLEAECFGDRPPRRRIEIGPLADTGVRPLDLRGWAPDYTAGERSGRPDLAEQGRRRVVERLFGEARDGRYVEFFFETAGSRNRFAELYGNLPGAERVRLCDGVLSDSCRSDAAGFHIIAECDFYDYRTRRPVEARRRKAGRRAREGRRYEEAFDIQPGDLVVHVEHGIGRYLGLFETESEEGRRESLVVEYADRARLYLPVDQAHLLSRYVGAGRSAPRLHKLGGRRWSRERDTVEHGVRDLAARMLETQAARELEGGRAFSADTAWQAEFEASFPYTETDDQLEAIREVKRDLESPRPMDRLICGDAGYGKTEVAMRAAFKAVMDGAQAAVLVPTTVLAQQHYDNFSERMAAFPVRVDMLSRFRSPKEQRRIVGELADGALDIVIGTHRMLSKDIRFHDLGLVVIDEEQRFGVDAKEKLKRLRQHIDVLTMTATPIPRTLYMSLTGVRDMSTIQTPPRERQAIDTEVREYDEALIREAALRELNRDGQIFYLHNRVETIEKKRGELERLLPEARIGVAHGRMDERSLSEVMHRFSRGEIDLLLCTTIIESGLDLPRVNTMFIERADRFGLAELYQLRGRVGRSRHRAYACLLIPRHGALFADARKRIRALRRHSGLGSGFQLALRDLEIRGAGNLLGAKQSGHIASVGFELYCRLLRRTVARLRNEPVPPLAEVRIDLEFIRPGPPSAGAGEENAAYIPHDYMEDETARIRFYRRITAAAGGRELRATVRELRDRFGPLPPPVRRLARLTLIRLDAAALELVLVRVHEQKVMLQKDDGSWLRTGSRFPRLCAETPDGRLRELGVVLRNC
ncbi:transcription-repair coupling factor [Kiritimatiella glycovorans]|uniref:Transcription-repair-coupling factor n=1 Tax=Kiritimatiella glycovorans TaxID=1307763 RepID=A0A0G3EH37_9BACT|nr:transcription-repair coupling factor [Kiritimatiella glycovorans]AKJ63449.1 Transcription-repair-coupling factor [Kiritimatiella glycovorans]